VERLEALASRFIEGWSARLFGAKLQPVQIAKRVIRAMEAHQTISLSKTFVPNSYVISLSPSDFEQFEQYRRSLERDLSEAVLGAARDRSYTLLAYPTVEIERDEDLQPGDMRVSCALVDASGDEVAPDAKALGAVEAGHTMVLDREKLLRERPRAPKACARATTVARSRLARTRSRSGAIHRTTSRSTTGGCRGSTPRSASALVGTPFTTFRARTART